VIIFAKNESYYGKISLIIVYYVFLTHEAAKQGTLPCAAGCGWALGAKWLKMYRFLLKNRVNRFELSKKINKFAS